MQKFELQSILDSFVLKMSSFQGYIDIESINREITELDDVIGKDGFWDNAQFAAQIQKKRLLLDKKKNNFLDLKKHVEDYQELLGLLDETAEELVEIEHALMSLEKKIEAFETELLLSGEYDSLGAYVTLYAGTGGTEAMDWTEMLLRMYCRYFDVQEWNYTIMDSVAGEEAGLKSVTLEVDGLYVYGKMKCEHGVHRLVRNSPFNSKGLRQTSFAAAEVMPKVELSQDVDIDEKDLRVDVFRASGAGGQHVNKTNSAVRITHIPTNIVVQCQTDRSQLRNRETAMSMLISKLLQMKSEQNKEKISDLRGENKQASWGNQIRSYVFSPYTLVKDHRTSYETSQVDQVMDGDLEGFIHAKLLEKI